MMSTYRYHEVLRGHLEGVLLEEQGEAAVRAANLRAAELLEAADALPEALVAYCRAEAWDAAERLVAREGRQLAAGSAPWLEVLPAATLRHDPWLVLAAARRHRAEGRWAEAVEAYQRAELDFGAAAPALACRRERLAIVPWLEPSPGPSADWSGRLRAGLSRDPLGLAGDPGERGATGANGLDERFGEGLVRSPGAASFEAWRCWPAADRPPPASCSTRPVPA